MRHHFDKRAVYYDWSYRSIAKILGCSPNTARKHVCYLISKGLLVKEGNNLRLMGRNALLQANETPIPVLIGKTKQQQILYLRNAIIAYSLIRQKRKISKKTSLVEKCNSRLGRVSRSQLREISIHGGSKKFEESIVNRTTLSNNSFGEKLNRSSSSAKRYKKGFIKEGLIKRKPFYKVLSPNSCLMEAVHHSFFGKGIGYSYRHGSLVKQSSDTLILTGFNEHGKCYATSSSSNIAHA